MCVSEIEGQAEVWLAFQVHDSEWREHGRRDADFGALGVPRAADVYPDTRCTLQGLMEEVYHHSRVSEPSLRRIKSSLFRGEGSQCPPSRGGLWGSSGEDLIEW